MFSFPLAKIEAKVEHTLFKTLYGNLRFLAFFSFVYQLQVFEE